MVKIVVDSTADLPAEQLARLGIEVVPVMLQIDRETFRDTVDITRDRFYQRLVESRELPRTAAPPVGLFEEVFRSCVEQGHEVVSLSVAAGLSSTYGSAVQAARLVDSERISCFDTATTTMAMGFLALAAAEAAAAGEPRPAILALLERLRPRTLLYIGLDTLHYLEKGGRIGRVQALLGSMLSVKPILEVRDGAVLPLEQVRTARRLPGRLVELGRGRGRFSRASALYTTDRAAAEQLADACAEAGILPRDQITVTQVTAALGTHVGPGAIGLAGLLE
ncbi:MAG TPA: DegV family protein [Roseiflexaceae bacterium]|nr:DegV family protein [Roseiflexaceae bacterium]